jgi:hypothetical protein
VPWECRGRLQLQGNEANPFVLSPLSAPAHTSARKAIERQAPLRRQVKLLFTGELLIVLEFSLSLRAPCVDTGATSRGYGQERESTRRCVLPGRARTLCARIRELWSRDAKFLDTRRDGAATGDSLSTSRQCGLFFRCCFHFLFILLTTLLIDKRAAIKISSKFHQKI